jgi:BTB/POZ domain
MPSLKVSAHQCIIASRSPYFQQLFKEKQHSHADPLVIDFQGQVCYEAFRKVIDYMYLDDVQQWLLDQAQTEASSSHEMIEIIKLAKQYRLDALFKACETHFKELMV